MDTTEAALLAAILADPDDDAPRLIFADFLDEQGESDRAEFIRVQCLIAAFKPPPANGKGPLRRQWDALRRREGKLLDDQAWLNWAGEALRAMSAYTAESHDGEIDWSFRRGFVAGVTCTAEDWLRHGDEILAAQPVEVVTLTTWPVAVSLDVTSFNDRSPRHLLRLDGRRVAHDVSNVAAALRLEWPRVREWRLPRAVGGVDPGSPRGSFTGVPLGPWPR